jgi:4-aminobutyrate aminotransferase-like enzyme
VLREEKLVENSARRGAELLSRLGRLPEKARLAGDVRGLGLMIGIELVLDRKTKEPAPKEAKALRAAMRERGILVGVGGVYGNVVRLQPPLSITAEECDRAASALEEILSTM